MKNFLPGRGILVWCVIACNFFFSRDVKAQAFNFNDFFPHKAITFFSPDSNNMIYDQLHTSAEMVHQLDSIFPFYTNEYYGAYPNIQPADSISFLPGLHQQIPFFDNIASEVKGSFTLYNRTDYWYAYYKKSIIDTTTAIVIFPGFGYDEGFLIANAVAGDYHNFGCFIKDKCLEYGDVYTIVKPNEDFRCIWKDTANNHYNKLDYDVMGPFSEYIGKNWAANLYIEVLAQLKYLQSKYKKVIIIGLSNGGFPALVCGLEAGVDGINCASGLSVTSYTGFPVPNNENPYFSNVFNYYSLQHLSEMIHNSGTTTLFSYGAGDCCTNAYEYTNHALQNYFNNPVPTCNTEFAYNFVGHTFPCVALDGFFTATIKSPKALVQSASQACAYDSLQVSVSLSGVAPFSMDLFKDGSFYRHYNTNAGLLNITLYDEGEYYISNLVDANNYPFCKSKNFNYTKPATAAPFISLSQENSNLVAAESPYIYHWYRNAVFIDSTNGNVLTSRGSGEYYVLLLDSAGCTFKSNSIIQDFPFTINIYPNPAQVLVNILVDGEFVDNWSYTIYNNLGQRIITGYCSLPHELVNIQNLARGIYNFSVEYTDPAGKKIRKTIPLIKQ